MIPHEPWLVALSIAIAIQGSFVGLSLARGTGLGRGFSPTARLRWIGDDARDRRLVDAFRRHAGREFPQRDRLSRAADAGLLPHLRDRGRDRRLCRARARDRRRCASARARWRWGSASASCIMSACRRCIWPDRPSYAPSYVVASIACRSRRAPSRLWTLDSRPTRPRLFLGAVALGLAISGMHYTAMAGMRLDPLCFDVSRFVGADSALSRNTLALLATVVAFGVSGAFLLSLVPDASAPELRRPGTGRTGRAGALQSASRDPAPTPFQEAAAPPSRRRSRRRSDGPPRSGSKRMGDARDIAVERHLRRPRQRPLHLCPRRRDRNISARSRSARSRRASIPTPFLRVHRSYIVSVDRIARVKRQAKPAIAELGMPVRCSIPIARAPLPSGQARIGALAG